MFRRTAIAAIVAFCTAGAARADDLAPAAVRPPAQPDAWTQRDTGTAIVVGGAVVDVVALGLGLYAKSQRDSAREAGCSKELTDCPANALPDAESAYHAANRATVLFVVGTAAVGVGIYLRLTAPRARAVSLSPTLGPDTAGATLSGTF